MKYNRAYDGEQRNPNTNGEVIIYYISDNSFINIQQWENSITIVKPILIILCELYVSFLFDNPFLINFKFLDH